MPPAPDGCPHDVPIAPPATPIPPPCITQSWVESWEEDGEPALQLVVLVDHPELCWPSDCVQPIYFRRYGDRLWQFAAVYAEQSCAKDEGPLAWATLEVLNTGDWDALGIYTAPPPNAYYDLLVRLRGGRWHHTYLPLMRFDRGARNEVLHEC